MRRWITSNISKFRFLDNFYECKVTYQGITYQNSEAAFQAQKTTDPQERLKFANLPPQEAKSLGHLVSLRDDWEEIKDQIMYEVVKTKFQQNPELLQELLDTGDAQLIERNNRNQQDAYWGIDSELWLGYNKLGHICEKVREELGGWKRNYTDESVGLHLTFVE